MHGGVCDPLPSSVLEPRHRCGAVHGGRTFRHEPCQLGGPVEGAEAVYGT